MVSSGYIPMTVLLTLQYDTHCHTVKNGFLFPIKIIYVGFYSRVEFIAPCQNVFAILHIVIVLSLENREKIGDFEMTYLNGVHVGLQMHFCTMRCIYN